MLLVGALSHSLAQVVIETYQFCYFGLTIGDLHVQLMNLDSIVVLVFFTFYGVFWETEKRRETK